MNIRQLRFFGGWLFFFGVLLLLMAPDCLWKEGENLIACEINKASYFLPASLLFAVGFTLMVTSYVKSK